MANVIFSFFFSSARCKSELHTFLSLWISVGISHQPTNQSETSKHEINWGWIFNSDTPPSGKWLLQGHLCKKKKLMYQKNELLSRHKDNFREEKLKMDQDKGKIFCVQWQVGVAYRYLTFFKEAFVLFLWDVFLLRIASSGPFLLSK